VHVAGDEPAKYRAIADDVGTRIRGGEYAPGSRLPPKARLMKDYRVALGTLDRAIAELRLQGYVETRQGVGMFVSDPLPQERPRSEYEAVMSRIDELSEEVRQLRGQVAELRKGTGG
jgi:GntR family transcriptional regulator